MRTAPLALMAALVSALPLAAQEASGPAPLPLKRFTVPFVTEAVLPNGLRLIVLERHRQPVVSIALSLPAGTSYDPPQKEGVADMLAALLTRGAGKRDASGVATAMEAVGGTLGASADPDYVTIQADVISNQAPLALELIGDAILRPRLDSAEIEGYRSQAVASLESGLGEVGTLAARIFLLGTYRNDPYSRRATPESMQAIQRADLLAALKARVRPAGSILVIAGDITPAAARRLVLAALGAWKGARPVSLPRTPMPPAPGAILLVHAGGVPDASIIVGHTTFAGNDSAYYAAAVLGRVLGDTRSGRLATSLAVQHAWSPVAGASFLRTARLGLFQVTADAPTEVADSALGAIYDEVRRLRRDLVPTDELTRAKLFLSGSYALRIQTVSQLVSATTDARLLSLPANYVSTYRARIMAVTTEQVRALARRILPDSGTITVVVGDAARLYKPLTRFGPVRIFSSEGQPLSPDAIQPENTPLEFDVSAMDTSLDSLAILAQGRTVGLQVTNLVRARDTITYTEHTVLGNALSQTTTLVFDSAGRMRRLDQSGSIQGRNLRIQIAYDSNRVRGSAVVPSPAGSKTLAIDTTVSRSIVDDNGVQAILPMLKWDVNRRWTFDVFAASENRIRKLTLTAADLGRFTVPAGTYDCYRADLEGGRQRISYYVTKAAPHRVVRIEIANSPIEFVAVNP
ncbi:MAG TPA: insulinase family protein [Gemmatimonadales bacterium]|nr:insulinase family protein [Gemmatimonadales bacterium]